jgi:hypothetical protein
LFTPELNFCAFLSNAKMIPFADLVLKEMRKVSNVLSNNKGSLLFERFFTGYTSFVAIQKRSKIQDFLVAEPLDDNVWIMKLRWNLRNFVHYLRTKLYTDSLKKKLHLGHSGLCSYLLHGGTNSRSFNELQLFLMFTIKHVTSFGR